jgi:hypothetical protein
VTKQASRAEAHLGEGGVGMQKNRKQPHAKYKGGRWHGQKRYYYTSIPIAKIPIALPDRDIKRMLEKLADFDRVQGGNACLHKQGLLHKQGSLHQEERMQAAERAST